MRRRLFVGLLLAFLAGCQSPPEAIYLVTITDVNGNQRTSTLELTSDLDKFQKSLEQVIETQVMTFSGPRSVHSIIHVLCDSRWLDRELAWKRVLGGVRGFGTSVDGQAR